MVDKKFMFRRDQNPVEKQCDICKKSFMSVNGKLRCSDECVAESKRIAARKASSNKQRQRGAERRIQKERLRMIQELTNRVEADEKCIAEKLLDKPVRKHKTPAVMPEKRKRYSTNNTPTKPKIVLEKRDCLRCGKQFDSTGKGNRICVTCNNRNHEASGMREFTVTIGRGMGGGNY